MKKLMSLMLALCMALSLVPAVAEGTDVTGAWYAAKLGDGETMVDISMLGTQMILTLNADGTATMDASGEDVQTGAWEGTAEAITVTFEDQPITGAVANGELTLSAEGQVIIFNREAPAPIEFAQEKSDAVLEDFNGVYTLTWLQNGESYISAEAAALAGVVLPNLTIENGKISLGESEEDSSGIIAILNLFLSQTLELKDGRLIGSLSLEGVETSSGIDITLLQDGMIWVELLNGEESMFNLYFSPVKE